MDYQLQIVHDVLLEVVIQNNWIELRKILKFGFKCNSYHILKLFSCSGDTSFSLQN